MRGSVQGKILWNHLWEHRFSVPDPRVFPPPGGRFSAPTTENRGRFPFNKNSGLKFRKLHVLNGTVHSGCQDPTQATARFGIVASQHIHNYALKEKSKYCLYPKEHSTVEKRRWKTKGEGILFRVESLWMQVKVKNACELKLYVSQNIRTIQSNSWNCTVNKYGVLANL